MIENKDSKIIEAILFASHEPVHEDDLIQKMINKNNFSSCIQNLQKFYENRGINLIKTGKKWSFRTSEKIKDELTLFKSQKRKLSREALETLSIIAYQQPITRSEIENIRGVQMGRGSIDHLMEIGWIKPSGRKNVPGKPIQYITTEEFLSHFNLQKLTDLPNVEELTSAGLIDSGNVDTSIFGTGKFFKEQMDEKKENIYSNIDDMLNRSLKSEEE